MKEGKWDSQVNEDLQRKELVKTCSNILFCNCETKEPLIVISVTALTNVAQVLKGTAATLQRDLRGRKWNRNLKAGQKLQCRWVSRELRK